MGNNLTQYYTASQLDWQTGYFYRGSSGYPSTSISFGSVESPSSQCSWLGTGYGGFVSIEEAHSVAEIQYSDSTVSFGTRAGIIVNATSEYSLSNRAIISDC